MSINIGKLKGLLSETIAKDYIAEGFSFNKSQFSFSKKIGQNKISSLFLFYDFSPLKVEYHFSFSFIIKEIELEIKKFYEYSGRTYKKIDTVLLQEGDFHPKVKDETPKLRGAYTHILTNVDDKDIIEESRLILKNEFFTRLHIFSDLNNFQEYIINNFNKTIDFNMILSSLIALKLKSHDHFIQFAQYLIKELQLEKKDDSHTQKILFKDIMTWERNG